jgi:thiamine-phosphate pyrophosphorylase
VCPRNRSGFAFRKAAQKKPILCYVTDRRVLGDGGSPHLTELLLEKIAALAAASVDWIQIREKDLSGRATALLVGRALRCTPEQAVQDGAPVRTLVNDRLDVALAKGAGGVHLGENSLPVSEAVRLVRENPAAEGFLVGVSTHSLEGAKSAASCGASYIFFGPVFATPSKASYGEPQGLDRLAEVCGAIEVPVLAIGGITLANTRACLSAGAAGIAAIRLFQNAHDPKAIVDAIRGAM